MFGDFSAASATDPQQQQQQQQSHSMTQSEQFTDHTQPLSMQTTTNQQPIACSVQGGASNSDGQGATANFNIIAATQSQQALMTTGSMSSSQQQVNGHLSPLEIIDQAEDDERLLQALEGLTLDTSGIEDSEQPQSEHQNIGNSNVSGDKEPISEHGTRTQFIKDVSERLISRVNTEATNIDEAKQLMQQYMIEFCAEYDRCGYSLTKCSPQQNSTMDSSKADISSQSDNQCGSTDRTSSSASQHTSSTSQSPSVGAKNTQIAGKRNTDQQMLFESKILKKGVRVLSKNLQRANEQNRVKDQQLKVMRSILMHQKNQISNLQAGSSQLLLQQQQNQLQFGQSAPASAPQSESNSSNPSPTAAASHQLTGMMNELHFSELPDSSMMERPQQQQAQDLPQNQASVEQTASEVSQQQEGLAQRAILNRSLHLQSMSNMQNFGHHQNPDIC